ncbi:hypothetical protein O6H91_21G010500 [Diphasiastrum complanatum]|uniref:Uncharacterized protein n=5 Tax=Diphasiastrum complanatum TaxID=34168 RepID=A0ACC2AI18_DIPCM|nr:hypothetical protein O6H91_21G010500 [Diphasiastrum complanatum]KAJ7517091.1 hypothetical protein O6H91_21G010500 [Diphasiastrum complanatum]KAJ7517092.1 hypothetical protein O6H91_21G010500 [Diphasiastrum complanatum]KAJ7517093.1 hypothetical protein O6H91_21G010500 [Diphasiastrum complanatum]KAJ7517094.1 hypothetical protein O6H91_21G010500 [Diphasiastrum complanatum]
MMGKWLSAVKRAFAAPNKSTGNLASSKSDVLSDMKQRKPQKFIRQKRRWSFGSSTFCQTEAEIIKQPKAVENRKTNYSTCNGFATDSAQSKTVFIHILESSEEKAAIKIQRAFRRHLARRTVRVTKGLIRLQSLVKEDTVRSQTRVTLHGLQGLVKIQAQIRAMRIERSERNPAIQKQLWHRRQQEMRHRKTLMDGINHENDWNSSSGSLEEVQSKLHRKQKAILTRERALEYAFSHQLWKTSPKEAEENEMSKPQWEWNWSACWLAPRPWDAVIPYTRNALQSIPEIFMENILGSGTESNTLCANGLIASNKYTSIPPESQLLKLPSNIPIVKPDPVLSPAPKSPSDLAYHITEMKDELVSANCNTPKISKSCSQVALKMTPTREANCGNDESDHKNCIKLSTAPRFMAATQSAKAKFAYR